MKKVLEEELIYEILSVVEEIPEGTDDGRRLHRIQRIFL